MWTPNRGNMRYNLNAVHDGRLIIPLLYEPSAKMLIIASETVWTHDASILEGNNLWGWGGGETLEIVKKKKEKKKATEVGTKISSEVKLGGASFVIYVTLIFMMNILDLIIFIDRMRFKNYLIPHYSYFKFINFQIKRGSKFVPLLYSAD